MSLKGLRQEVIKLIKFGKSEEEIIRGMVRANPDYEVSDVEMEVRKTCTEFPNYKVIQKVMRSEIITDIEKENSELLLVDYIDRDITTVSAASIKKMTSPKLDLSGQFYHCVFEYRPLDYKLLIQDKSKWVYNTYVPPFWLKNYIYSDGKVEVKKEEDYPGIYKDFFNHLFDGNKRSWEYTLDWLANAVQDRNYCILTTIGRQGIGKGLFGTIMEKIFGTENFYAGRDEMFRGRFNSQLLDKRIVYADEIKIDSSIMEDRVKAVINDNIEVEAKGKDAVYVKNYASVYISSNRLDSLRLQADDRRFSIVDLTNTQIIDPKSNFRPQRIPELFEEKNIELLARYLYYRPVDKEKMLKVFKSERTEEVRNSSLKMWEEWVLDDFGYDNQGKVMPLKEVADAIENEFGSKFTVGRPKFQDLETRFPGKIKVRNTRKVKGKKQTWTVEFPIQE